MNLERGQEFYQKLSSKHAILSLWGSSGEIHGTWFIFIWHSIFYWNCTFVLLDDVEWIEDRSILLKHMSRTYYKWCFYLLILFTYVLNNIFFSNHLCMKIWISIIVISLLYDDDLCFMMNIWINFYVIYFS